MKRTCLMFAFTLALGGAAYAAQGQYIPISVNEQPSFAYVDVNEDGAISMDEANHAHVLYGNQFIAADKNKDGWLSKKEYDEAMMAKREANHHAPSG